MKRLWVSLAIVGGIALLGSITYMVINVSNNVEYEMLSYQVQYLDAQGITIRIMFAVSNPMRYNLDIWDQSYDVFVAGYKVSKVTSLESYRLLAENTSVIPLDVRLNWEDIDSKLSPFASQSASTTIGDLPIVIKGNLSAKLGALKLKRVPIKTSIYLKSFLP